MRRTWSIILSILIGALAVGIGMGIFLKLANDDRARLAAVAAEAKKISEQAQTQSRQAIEEAKGKLDQANQEIEKARLALERLEIERALLADAEILAPAKNLKGWKEAVSLSLGVSLKIPPKTEIENNTSNVLTSIIGSSTGTGTEARWLSLTSFDQRLEKELAYGLSATSSVVYAVKGRAVYGLKGSDALGNGVYILRILKNGEVQSLLWIRSLPSAWKISPTDIIATLDFQK